MTITQVIARIIARGFAVTTTPNMPHAKYPACNVAVNVTRNGIAVAWPNFKLSDTGKVLDVSIGAYHGVADSSLTQTEVAAIYGDIYMANTGKPTTAEKIIAAMLATPTQPVVEYNPELDATVNPTLAA